MCRVVRRRLRAVPAEELGPTFVSPVAFAGIRPAVVTEVRGACLESPARQVPLAQLARPALRGRQARPAQKVHPAHGACKASGVKLELLEHRGPRAPQEPRDRQGQRELKAYPGPEEPLELKEPPGRSALQVWQEAKGLLDRPEQRGRPGRQVKRDQRARLAQRAQAGLLNTPTSTTSRERPCRSRPASPSIRTA